MPDALLEGRFRVPDVPPGHYTIQFEITGPPVADACGAGTGIGRVHRDVSVPEAKAAFAPLDLGDVPGEIFDTLDVGEQALDVELTTLDGEGTIKLADLRGKVVLIDFWATWCGPCRAEMPNLQTIQNEHGDDPRFVLLSVASDYEQTLPQKYVAENGFDWMHGYIRGLQGGVAEQFSIRSVPATFLIGPDGKVIGKGDRGKDLRDAVAKALKTLDSE